MVLELSASHLAHVVGVHVARHTVPFVFPSLGLVGFVKNQSIFLIKRSYNAMGKKRYANNFYSKQLRAVIYSKNRECIGDLPPN